MYENSVLVAIETALRSPTFCACGSTLDLKSHDDSLWLECDALSKPSRLPLMKFLRDGLHDRHFVADLPEPEATPVPAEQLGRGLRAARPVATGA